MRILKILFVFFLIYFIRRFIHMYRVMKNIQEEQMRAKANMNQANYQHQNQQQFHKQKDQNVINADFKVID